MKILDKNFREANIARHPDMEPYLVFNDKPGSPTIYFVSQMNASALALQLHTQNPGMYYYPEKREYQKIVIKQGGFARLPHSLYRGYSTDDTPVTYSIRSESQL